ncbi:hypothetical protein, partial [Actinoplanes xinjiangensis]|uniref:hypothetical protein n=1 Tax=Actinoplanes xinjiangensis TaxID=512350 RepID=UPI0019434835
DANKVDGLTRLAFKSVEPVSPTTQKSILNDFKADLPNGAKTLIQVAGATHSALSGNPHTTSQSPPPNPGAVATGVDLPPSGPPAPKSPEWRAAYDNAEQKQLRTERYNPSKDTIVPGTHLLRGEITTIDFTSRDFTVDGKDYRSFEVKLDLTSKNDQMTPDQLRQVADTVQNTIDQMVNGKHTLPNGRELHVQLTVDTVPWSADLMDTWQDRQGGRPPVQVTSEPLPDPARPDDHSNDGNTTQQHRWNINNNAAVLVHEVMHYLGAKEGYHADHHLFNTQDRPGVMGAEVYDLPSTTEEAAAGPGGPTTYLYEHDLQLIENVSETAGPVPRTAPAPAAVDPAPRGDAHTDSPAPKSRAPMLGGQGSRA